MLTQYNLKMPHAVYGGENAMDNITAIIKAKPASAKGQYIRTCVTASTMGPGIKINAPKTL